MIWFMYNGVAFHKTVGNSDKDVFYIVEVCWQSPQWYKGANKLLENSIMSLNQSTR